MQNSNAYLLFYRRRSDKPLGGETQEKVAAYREKIQSKELNGADAESAQGLDGAVASASTQSLDPEYKHPFVHSRSPDHSPPEHNEFAYGDELPGYHSLDFESISPFGPHLPLDNSDHLSSFPLSTFNTYISKKSASSSNEAISATSSFDPELRDNATWNPSDIIDDEPPDLEDADSYYPQEHVQLDDIDSDNLDDDPPLVAITTSLPVTPPLQSPLSTTRETAPSPPSTNLDASPSPHDDLPELS